MQAVILKTLFFHLGKEEFLFFFGEILIHGSDACMNIRGFLVSLGGIVTCAWSGWVRSWGLHFVFGGTFSDSVSLLMAEEVLCDGVPLVLGLRVYQYPWCLGFLLGLP